MNQTKIVKNGLGSLRDDHYSILASIRDDYENHKNQICNNNTEVDILHAGVVSDDDHNHDTKEKTKAAFLLPRGAVRTFPLVRASDR